MKKGIITLVVVVSMMAECALSQSSWPDHENRTTVSLEWESPRFSSGYMGRIRTNQLTSVAYLNARIRVTDNMFVLAEVPFSHFEWKLAGDESGKFNKNTERGNPFLGAEFRSNDNPELWNAFITIGTYLPREQKTWYYDELRECDSVLQEYNDNTLSRVAHNIKPGAHPALLSDFDRSEAFWEDTWSVRANTGATTMLSNSSTSLGFSTGLIHNIYRGEWAKLLNRELYYTYTAYFSHRLYNLTVHTLWYGRHPVGIRGLDFIDDALLQLRTGIGKDFGVVTLGGYVRVPLTSKYVYNVKFSYGLNLAINL